SSKHAWDTLKTEYQGSAKVISVKLQSLLKNFETTSMKNVETVQGFLAKVSMIVSQMRAYGDNITDETVVAKILRSLPPKFDHVVAAIEESKYISTLSFDELMGSLQAHEVRINRIVAREDEQAFQTTEDAEPSKRNQYTRGRGRGRYRGRGRGRTNLIYCSHCDKNGHSDDSCWFTQKHTKKKQRNQLPIVSVETSQSHTFNTSNSNKDSNILRCNRRLTNNPSLNPSPSPHDYDVRKTIEVGTTLGYNLTGHEVKLGWHNEDGFITIYGEWVNFGMPCFMIIVYAPQDMNAKCALWNRLVDLIRNFQDICIVLGDFNEVRYAIERIDSTFCKKVAEFFNSFIYNAELIDLPMGGFATKSLPAFT
ncbi:UBN2 domain-containing protein, partial [Tanacetum coccineum]